MDLSFLDQKTFFTIIHIIGVALGAGGAYVSDVIFMSSIKDNKISRTEMRFMTIASMFVWTGLLILIGSGIGLFFTDPDGYMNSSKFLSKMTIVLIIFLNGLIFHISHLPRIKRHVGEHFPSSDEFMRKKPLLFASGAVSFTSWTFALVLGSVSYLPYSYVFIMSLYFIVIVFAILTSFIIFKNKKFNF